MVIGAITVVSILVAVIGIIYGTRMYYEKQIKDEQSQHEAEAQTLQNQISSLNQENQELCARINGLAKTEVGILPQIKFVPIGEAFEHKLREMQNGALEMNIKETSDLWNRMFEAPNVTYLRATSLIVPAVWENVFMAKYDSDQRANIQYIKSLDSSERQRYQEGVKKLFADTNASWLGDNAFERIFIITDAHLKEMDRLADLIDTICTQSKYFDILVCYEGRLEARDRRDFGIAVSKDLQMWVYELSVYEETLYGGRIFCDTPRVVQATETYKAIQTNSEHVPQNADFKTLAKIVEKVCPSLFDISLLLREKEQKGVRAGHKCIKCFVESEATLMNGEWKSLPVARRVWYQMLSDENQSVLDFIRRRKPKRILEVGCGPGRFLGLLKRNGFDRFEEIVGIDCDAQMYDYAYTKFQRNTPPIRLYNMKVKENLPFDDERFDLCINAMNIAGWQDNIEAWLKEMRRCSRSVFFSLYKKGNEELRTEMYRKRGHKISGAGVHTDAAGQIVLGDCSVLEGVTSRAYSQEEIDAMCGSVLAIYDGTYTIDKETNELLYLCFIYDTKPS